MRSRPIVSTLVASVAIVLTGCGHDLAEPERAAASRTPSPRGTPVPTYRGSTPPAVKFGQEQRINGARVTAIEFDDGSGGRAEANLVRPPDDARVRSRPGVVFGHGYGGGKDIFVEEATALAARGVVSVLPATKVSMSGDPRTDGAVLQRSVVLERRALDVLLTRRDVDPDRLGYVGHSWGAIRAAILSADEPRLSALVYAGFGLRASAYAATWGRAESPRAYVKEMARFDPAAHLKTSGDRTVLFQFARNDENHWPESDYDTLVRVAADPKQRKDYDIGHVDLRTDPRPIRDRATFLLRTLRAE